MVEHAKILVISTTILGGGHEDHEIFGAPTVASRCKSSRANPNPMPRHSRQVAHNRLGVLPCDDVGGVAHRGPIVGSPSRAAHASFIRCPLHDRGGVSCLLPFTE